MTRRSLTWLTHLLLYHHGLLRKALQLMLHYMRIPDFGSHYKFHTGVWGLIAE
ncbi:hypothetical protein Tsubulata_024325 [Turnera subulata]|uniref:Uncharacterized protein n=1 Tax=Turnera subulata TaxID=218843 RepID=A0A9Q0F8U9_9ROSI|nr:hypothetical protein Tsubulata_024325 [Turnera subulata]